MTETRCKPDPIQVITSTQTRRRYSPAEKRSIIQESSEPGQSVSGVARKHGIAPSLLFYWRRIMENGALTAVGANDDVVPASEMRALKAQIRQLERVLGQKALQIEILKEAVTLAREKKLISRAPLLGVEDFQ
jgi:transposase